MIYSILFSLSELYPLFFSKKSSHKLNHLGTTLLPQKKRTVDAIKTALNTDIKSAKKIEKRSNLELFNFMTDYKHLSLKGKKSYQKEIDQIKCINIHKINEYAAAKKPMVFVSIHMNSFFYGMIKVCQRINHDSTVNILKYQKPSKKEELAYQHFNTKKVKTKIHRLYEKPALKLIRALKKNEVVWTYIDVNPNLISTEEVILFNKKAKIPKGPAELSLVSGALIVPVIMYQEYKTRIVEFLPAIAPPETYKKTDSAKIIKQTTQKLANWMTTWIKKFPEQWHFWPLMDKLWI